MINGGILIRLNWHANYITFNKWSPMTSTCLLLRILVFIIISGYTWWRKTARAHIALYPFNHLSICIIQFAAPVLCDAGSGPFLRIAYESNWLLVLLLLLLYLHYNCVVVVVWCCGYLRSISAKACLSELMTWPKLLSNLKVLIKTAP